jgi:tRNA (cmo5U34)-methyltransferase
MADNTTPFNADVYETEVRRTIPFHGELLAQAIAWARVAVPSPSRWLDTGCGPGRLVALAREVAPETAFFLADPSPAMITVARANNPDLPSDRFVNAPSQDLPDTTPFDVITAVQCHHYMDPAGRERAIGRCRSLLAPHGALIVFENVRAESDFGHMLQQHRWSEFMRSQGRTEEQIQAHHAREGTVAFYIRPSEHIALLRRAGFATVELIWRSYAQAGFLAVAA